jgi:DGQHR domain-containing protein
MEVKALKIKQWGAGEGVEPTEIYLTALPLSFLANRAEIDRWSKENREGYQRPPSERRLRPKKGSVVKYLLEELGVFPTSVLLNVREQTLAFVSEKRLTPNIEFGTLKIDDKSKLWIIDGQHRIEALKRAAADIAEFENYPLPVSLTNIADKFTELLQFYIINTRQNKIPTAIAYHHMQRFYEEIKIKSQYKWVQNVILGVKQEKHALAAMVVDYLAEEKTSPFYNKIKFFGEEREDHLVDDHVLIRYISTVFKEKIFTGISPIDLADILIDYWNAIKELYPNAFKIENKNRFTLLKHTGIAAFTYLFPFIYGLCTQEGKTDMKCMIDKLKLLREEYTDSDLDFDFRKPIDENWWSVERGPSIARATSEKVFREISEKMAKKIIILYKKR